MEITKRKGSTYACQPTVKPKNRIDTLKRIFMLKFKNIIPPSGASVKVLQEFYEENYEVFVAMEKLKRILLCAAFAACATVFIMCVGVIVQMLLN